MKSPLPHPAIAGRYTVEKMIGSGSLATVYRARDLSLQRTVAIKVIKSSVGKKENAIKRFEREAMAFRKLSHPNILKLYDAFITSDTALLIMEYLEGQSLEDLLMDGPIDGRKATGFVIQTAAALLQLHESGLVHRDIKTANIFLHGKRAVLMDFNLVSDPDMTPVTSDGFIPGTARNLSPELLDGEAANPSTDIYALGLAFYETLTGIHPFETANVGLINKSIRQGISRPPSYYVKSIPAALDSIVMRCCATRRSGRYESAEELLVDLAALSGYERQLVKEAAPGLDFGESTGLSPETRNFLPGHDGYGGAAGVKAGRRFVLPLLLAFFIAFVFIGRSGNGDSLSPEANAGMIVVEKKPTVIEHEHGLELTWVSRLPLRGSIVLSPPLKVPICETSGFVHHFILPEDALSPAQVRAVFKGTDDNGAEFSSGPFTVPALQTNEIIDRLEVMNQTIEESPRTEAFHWNRRFWRKVGTGSAFFDSLTRLIPHCSYLLRSNALPGEKKTALYNILLMSRRLDISLAFMGYHRLYAWVPPNITTFDPDYPDFDDIRHPLLVKIPLHHSGLRFIDRVGERSDNLIFRLRGFHRDRSFSVTVTDEWLARCRGIFNILCLVKHSLPGSRFEIKVGRAPPLILWSAAAGCGYRENFYIGSFSTVLFNSNRLDIVCHFRVGSPLSSVMHGRLKVLALLPGCIDEWIEKFKLRRLAFK